MINTEQLNHEFYLVSIIARVRVAEKIDDLFHRKGTSGATSFLAACFDEDDRRSLLEMQGARKEVLMKATRRDNLEKIVGHITERYPEKANGENFLLISPLTGISGLSGYGDIEGNSSFDKVQEDKTAPYRLVTVICGRGEGEEYIDATQREDILQHILIRGHGTAEMSNEFSGTIVQPEKDVVMQIVHADDVLDIKEFIDAYEGIQFEKAGAIGFTRDVLYLHRF